MKMRLLRQVISISLMLLLPIGVAHAKQCALFQGLQFKPYIGWEYQYEHIKGNGTWGEFMPANFQSQAFFVGTRYHQNFGLEVSYYHTLKKSQSSAFITSFNGTPDPSGTTFVIGQMRNEGFAFDWDVYFPLDPRFNLMAIVGIVTYHPNILVQASGGTNLQNALQNVTPNNKAMLRLGLGLEYEERCWGARARVLWDQTQTMTVSLNNPSAPTFGVQNDPFKQACIFTAGIFYIF
jgi:hypothetical protein